MRSKHKIFGVTSLILGASCATPFTLAQAETHINIQPLNSNSIFYAGEMGEAGEGSEQGESGEGGYSIADLKKDDVKLLSALQVIKAHYFIGQKLYNNNYYDEAENFFGHPISEVLSELSPALEYRKLPSLDDQMYALLETAQNKNQPEQLNQQIQEIFSNIQKINTIVNDNNPDQKIKNIAFINVDMLRRSKIEYFQAIKNEDLDRLYDAIGYFDVALQLFQDHYNDYSDMNNDKTEKIKQSFEKLQSYFSDYEQIDKTVELKKVAALVAKIELYLSNLK